MVSWQNLHKTFKTCTIVLLTKYQSRKIMNHEWNIVHFYNDGRVEVVPLTWLEAGSCSWPPYEKSRIATAIRECEVPAASWTQFPVRTITNATYGTLRFCIVMFAHVSTSKRVYIYYTCFHS